jgi:broad-specificity NMP kinase
MMFTRSFRIINYARRSVLQEWLRERGYDPTKILDFGEYKTIRKI